MKIVVDVKNIGKMVKPSANNVILYDGKEWYVTTKNDLFKEFYGILADIKSEVGKLKSENAAFKKDINEKMVKVANLVETSYSE